MLAIATGSGYAQNAEAQKEEEVHSRRMYDNGKAAVQSLPEKSFLLYFHPGNSLVDSEYRNNRETMQWLERLFTQSRLSDGIDSITIRSFTSPQGNSVYNRGLSSERLTALKKYLARECPHFNYNRLYCRAEGENWQKLHQLIICDTLLPYREEMLQIIERNGYTERCKVVLRKLERGRPYRQIHTHLYPLCDVSVITVRMKQENLQKLICPPFSTPKEEEEEEKEEREAGKIEAVTNATEQTALQWSVGLLPFPEDTYNRKASPKETRPHLPRRPLFAVKTNLLYDAALMPNVEIEVPIGKRWSVNGEYMFPWWLLKENKYSLEILAGGLEARYWLGRRKSNRCSNGREVLAGHFFGLYAGGGMYDLQWERSGYQGEFFISAGISYGYSVCMARHLRLEFNLGIGLLRTDYRHYRAQDNYQTLLWQEDGNYTWLGPTKVKISLVWLLTRKAKKGGNNER